MSNTYEATLHHITSVLTSKRLDHVNGHESRGDARARAYALAPTMQCHGLRQLHEALIRPGAGDEFGVGLALPPRIQCTSILSEKYSYEVRDHRSLLVTRARAHTFPCIFFIEYWI